jgi:hypothetical protein
MTGRSAGPRCGGLRRWLLLICIAITMVLVFAGAALAGAPMPATGSAPSLPSDIDEALLADYGLTPTQLLRISDGYPDGTWRPYTDVTRAEFAAFVVNGLGLSPVTPPQATFADVPSTHPLYGYVEAAAAAGMIKGRADGLFAPDASITRQQAAAIMVRYLVSKNGRDLNILMPETMVRQQLSRYADAGEVSSSLEKEVATAVARTALKGTSAHGSLLLNPTYPVTRIQAAALSLRQEKPGLSIEAEEGGGVISSIFEWLGENVVNSVICNGLERAWDALSGDDQWDEVSDDLKNIQSSIDEANKSVTEIEAQIAALKAQFLSEVDSVIAETDASKAQDATEAIDSWYSDLGTTNYRYYISLYQNPPADPTTKAADLTAFMDEARKPGGNLDVAVRNIYGAILPSSTLVPGVFTAWVDTICSGALSDDEVVNAYLSMEGYMCQLVLHQMQAVQIQCDALNARDQRDGIAQRPGMAHYPSATTYLTTEWLPDLQAESDEFLTEVTRLVLNYAGDLNNFTPSVLGDSTLEAILSRAEFVCCTLEEQKAVFADGSGTGDPQTAYGLQSLVLYPTGLVTHNTDIYAQTSGAAAIAGTVDKTLPIDGPLVGVFDTTVSPATLDISNAWTLKRVRFGAAANAHPAASFIQRHFAADSTTYQHGSVPLLYTSGDYTQSSTRTDDAVLYGCGVISYQHFSGTGDVPDAMWYRPAPMGSAWELLNATCWLHSSVLHPHQPPPTQTPGHSAVNDTYTDGLRWSQIAGLPYFTFVGPTGTKLGFRAYTATPGQTLATWTCNRPSSEISFTSLYLGLQQGVATPTAPPEALLGQSNMTANTSASPSVTAYGTMTNGKEYCFTESHDITWDSPGVPTKAYDLSMTLDTHFDHVGLVFGE